MLRILHVTPSISPEYGGPTFSLSGFIEASATAAGQCTVVAPARGTADARWFRDRAPRAELITHSVYGRSAFIVSPGLLQWVASHGHRFDVVHVHGLFNPVSSLSARLAARRGWPLVIRPFGTLSRFTFEHRRAALKRIYFAALDRRNVERAGALHFTTEGERDNAAWHALPHPERQHVVPPPFTGRADIDARGAEPAGPPIILLLGRLHPVKAVDAVLAAWPTIAAAHRDVRLVIAGDGDPGYVSTLRVTVAALRAADRIRFTGFVDGEAKQRLLADATVFVLPSHHENFGIAVLEAIAAGLPVVITADVQLAPFVQRHQLGHVTTREPAALAAAVRAALADRELAERCRRLGPSLVARHFSTTAIGARLVAMYEAARAATTR